MTRIGALAAALVLLAAAPACGGGGGSTKQPAGEQTKATGRWGQVYDNICAASAAAANGNPKAAKGDFDDIHAALHELAAAVERENRQAAARLLEAKQKVEAEADQMTAADLDALSLTVANGIRITGGTAPRRCP